MDIYRNGEYGFEVHKVLQEMNFYEKCKQIHDEFDADSAFMHSVSAQEIKKIATELSIPLKKISGESSFSFKGHNHDLTYCYDISYYHNSFEIASLFHYGSNNLTLVSGRWDYLLCEYYSDYNMFTFVHNSLEDAKELIRRTYELFVEQKICIENYVQSDRFKFLLENPDQVEKPFFPRPKPDPITEHDEWEALFQIKLYLRIAKYHFDGRNGFGPLDNSVESLLKMDDAFDYVMKNEKSFGLYIAASIFGSILSYFYYHFYLMFGNIKNVHLKSELWHQISFRNKYLFFPRINCWKQIVKHQLKPIYPSEMYKLVMEAIHDPSDQKEYFFAWIDESAIPS
jgi:hypothetical protein